MSNLSEYVRKATSGKSELSEVMERRKSAKAQELENLEFDALIAEAKKKLQDASPNKIDPAQATNFATMIFAGRTPAEIKEIIHSLTQEEIDKFSYMAASMNPNNFANMRGLLREPNTGTKEIVDAIKIGTDLRKPESNSISAKDLLDAIKTGMEISNARQPANSQNDGNYKLLEMTLGELKATREESARQERLKTDREIADLKNRPSALQELSQDAEKYQVYKKMFGGTDSAVTNDYSLKKLEMEQSKDIEDKKLGFEKEKWKYEKDNEGKIFEQIKDVAKIVTEGPVGEVIKSLGNAGAERIRGSGNKGGPKNSVANIGPAQCPNCKGKFLANAMLDPIQCPLCGATLTKGNQPPQEPQSPATQTEENPQETQAQTEQPPEKAEATTEEQGVVVVEQPTSQ